jgi:flagellar protein FlaG
MKIDPTMPIMLSGAGATPKPNVAPRVQDPVREMAADNGTDKSQQTEAALKELSDVMAPFNISLKFTKDQDTGTIVIQMVDQKSGDTLRQIPSEASLRVAATIAKLQGKIFSRIA